MKAGISNIWLLGMIMIFIFLFSCYVIISVNYTKSFKIKNEVLHIIEMKKGMTIGSGASKGQSIDNFNGKLYTCDSILHPGTELKCNIPALQTINMYLLGNAYTAKGTCDAEGDEMWGVDKLEVVSFEKVVPGKKYYYCFAKYRYGADDVYMTGGNKTTNLADTSKYINYFYRVRLFYKMELPVLQNWLSVRVEGETAPIVDVQDSDYFAPNQDQGYRN